MFSAHDLERARRYMILRWCTFSNSHVFMQDKWVQYDNLDPLIDNIVLLNMTLQHSYILGVQDTSSLEIKVV